MGFNSGFKGLNDGLHYSEMSLIRMYSVAVCTFLLIEGVGTNL